MLKTQEEILSQSDADNRRGSVPRLSVDFWAVVLSLAAALLVRFDLIRNVKW